jgi:beta-phosphoglucomutase-like phosphatase (HAD superfamily)
VNFDLIIFDCDGVLVDSEVISCRAHADVLSRHGYPITQEQVFDRFLGRSTRQANSEVEAELGRALPDDFHVQLQTICSGRSKPICKRCRTFTWRSMGLRKRSASPQAARSSA